MPSQVATLVFALGIAGLFLLDREPKVKTSKALWLPVIWIWIVGSRPVSEWLGGGSGSVTAAQLAEGSPLDAAVFAALLGAGLVVLAMRKRRTVACLKASWPIVIYFAFCLLSLFWSDFASVAFKRWTKALGDLVMVIIVVTDPQPGAALRRLFARTGFILMPVSVLLIKYYGDLGRGFDAWGGLSITGVTTNKNLLGVIVLVLALGASWRVLSLWRDKDQPDRRRHLMAQGTLLAICVALFVMTHSATSGSCFMLGTALMVATGLPVIGRRPAAVHKLVGTVVLLGALAMISGAEAEVVHAMGRKTDFTGRTAIWATVIPMAPNPIIGAGYESFWLGPRLEKVWRAFPVFLPNEAHNGYIEIYLELGVVGLCLIALILLHGYWCAVATFRRDPSMGGLALAYVVVSSIYSVTEAGFRLLDPIWIFLLLAVVSAARIASSGAPRAPRRASAASARFGTPASEPSPALIPSRGTL